MSPSEKATIVKSLARRVGFDRVGITHAGPPARSRDYREWLAAGYAGEMAYLKASAAARGEPASLLPGARSLVCVALNYRRGEPERDDSHGETGRVAQYARGADYHTVIHRMLARLSDELRRVVDEPFETRAFVDTGPVLERELAARAGIGWIGKNTMLLHHELGSFFFLGELLTTLELAADEPLPDRCGSCTRCLEACPTAAFPAPHVLDATRCISYLTIEHRGQIDPTLAARMSDWVFGCDVCQQVCPFNGRAPLGLNPDLGAERLPARVPLARLAQLSSGEYRRLTRGTAARRASRKMWRRNADIALENRRRGA